jgi:hypothetical protein
MRAPECIKLGAQDIFPPSVARRVTGSIDKIEGFIFLVIFRVNISSPMSEMLLLYAQNHMNYRC